MLKTKFKIYFQHYLVYARMLCILYVCSPLLNFFLMNCKMHKMK